MKNPLLFEENKIICEFMGCEVYESFRTPHTMNYTVRGPMVIDFRNRGLFIGGFEDKMMMENLRFHVSFDWIMIVIEKIELMGHKTIVGGGDFWGQYCNIMYFKSEEERKQMYASPEYIKTKALGQASIKILAIFNAVVEFIKWYNLKHNI